MISRNELAWMLDDLQLRDSQVIVHANLAGFGEIEGGAATLCAALMELVGDSGTILMPAYTDRETLGEAVALSSADQRPRPVAFHLDLPVNRDLGEVAEVFRKLPGVLRSNHPSHSFSAWGRHARDMLSTQRDNNSLGPLKKLHLAQGHVILLGTTLEAATVIHLAEEQFPLPYLQRRTASRLNSAGYDERVVIENVPGCSTAFRRLESLLDPDEVKSVQLPRGWGLRIPTRYLVRLATSVLQRDPASFVCDDEQCEGCEGKRNALRRRPTVRVETPPPPPAPQAASRHA